MEFRGIENHSQGTELNHDQGIFLVQQQSVLRICILVLYAERVFWNTSLQIYNIRIGRALFGHDYRSQDNGLLA